LIPRQGCRKVLKLKIHGLASLACSPAPGQVLAKCRHRNFRHLDFPAIFSSSRHLFAVDIKDGLIVSPYRDVVFPSSRPSEPHVCGSDESEAKRKRRFPRFLSVESPREIDQDVQVSKGLFSGALPGTGVQSNAGTLCIYAALNGGHATTGCDM